MDNSIQSGVGVSKVREVDAPELVGRMVAHVNRERLVEIANRLIEVPSPTGQAGEVADRLAEILIKEGFAVDRPVANHPAAPAVVVRQAADRSGRVLQFNGHLDTVHLPFVPPGIDSGRLTGSGASDMKGGLAAAVEAFLAIRDAGGLAGGAVLLTAHDLHEAPWGFGQQIDRLIDDGVVGNAVLIPEPLSGHLPVAGRGQACWKATLRRSGPPIHEVMRPTNEPDVLAIGGELLGRLHRLGRQISRSVDPVAGNASVFIGQFHGGEIYNQFPSESWLEGTRRWLPGTSPRDVEREFRELVDGVGAEFGVSVELRYQMVRDAFFLDTSDPVVTRFQQSQRMITGRELEAGSKPFVDDGNSFWARAKIPAITHGPLAGGQHTLQEWVCIDDLVRVAQVYALTANLYCPNE